MNKAAQLFFCCLVILGCFSDLSIRVQGSDELPSLNTVKARRDRLAQLLIERERSQADRDRVAIVQLSNQIAQLYLKLCEFDSALKESQTALETARNIGSGEGQVLVDTLTLAARIHIDRTESPSALLLANEALSRSQELGYRKGEAQSQLRLAEAYFELDRRDEAAASNDRALEIWIELQDKRGEGLSRVMQGDLLMMNNQPAEASVAFKKAEANWRELNDPIELATSLVDQNFLAIRQGQFQNALTLLNEAQTLLVEKDAEPYLAAKIANSFGEIYEAYGQLDTALSYFRESLSHFRDVGHDVKGTVTAGIKVGRVLASLNNFEAAKQQMQESLAAALVTDNALTIGL
jgi:tetratricopeptide (TPR) repeat protein